MKIWKMGLGVGAVFGAIFALMACSSSSSGGGGGGFSCTEKGSCPNDTAPTQMQIDQCNMAMSDPNCGSKYTALGSCLSANVTGCDANGKTMVDQTKCQSQEAAYIACALGGVDGGTGG